MIRCSLGFIVTTTPALSDEHRFIHHAPFHLEPTYSHFILLPLILYTSSLECNLLDHPNSNTTRMRIKSANDNVIQETHTHDIFPEYMLPPEAPLYQNPTWIYVIYSKPCRVKYQEHSSIFHRSEFVTHPHMKKTRCPMSTNARNSFHTLNCTIAACFRVT